jgi:hypothetical protein
MPGDALPDDEAEDDTAAAQTEQQWHAGNEAPGGEHGDAAPEHADIAAAHPHGHLQPGMPGYDAPPEAPSDDEEEDWAPPPAETRQRTSSLSQPITAAYDGPEPEEDAEMSAGEDAADAGDRRALWQRGLPSSGPDADGGYPIPSGAYEVPSDAEDEPDAPYAQTEAPGQPEADETPAPMAESWSSRFMGPGWRGSRKAPAVEEEEDEDPETFIRESFRSALERTDEEESAAPVHTGHEEEASRPFGSIYDADWNRSDDEEEDIQAAHDPESALRQHRASFEEDPDTDPAFTEPLHPGPETGHGDPDYFDEDDAPEADTPSFLRRGLRPAEPDEDELYGSEPRHYDAADDEDDDDADRATLARFAPPAGRPQPFGMDDEADGIANPDEPQDYDALYGGQFDEAAERRVDDLDDTLVGLRDTDDDQDVDLDALDDVYAPENQGRSGLAVAAGWVAFMSLMGGLLLGVFNFRQDVMAALPGTVNMYRMLGYEVALNKVDFASVNYNWSEIDGRPAIELKGEVINITDETVRVPPVLVNVQSTSGANLRAEASVPTDELGPRGSATFTLELVSPPEDVTQIELEFAPAR